MNQFLDLNKEKEPIIQSSDSFDLQEVFSRFSKPKEVTIQDLKEELNNVKLEIRLIKDRLSNVEKDKEKIQITEIQDEVKPLEPLVEEPKIIHKISKKIVRY